MPDHETRLSVLLAPVPEHDRARLAVEPQCAQITNQPFRHWTWQAASLKVPLLVLVVPAAYCRSFPSAALPKGALEIIVWKKYRNSGYSAEYENATRLFFPDALASQGLASGGNEQCRTSKYTQQSQLQ